MHVERIVEVSSAAAVTDVVDDAGAVELHSLLRVATFLASKKSRCGSEGCSVSRDILKICNQQQRNGDHVVRKEARILGLVNRLHATLVPCG